MPELDTLVTIKLDKERHLRLTLKGMIEFDKATGRNLLKGFVLKVLSIEEVANISDKHIGNAQLSLSRAF